MEQVTIIGGGIAGLISAIRLAKAKIPCMLIEKKAYPFHRVCGEYISNEVVPFLISEKLYPQDFSPAQINTLKLSTNLGKTASLVLESGGFGISRYTYDNFLFQEAQRLGVKILVNTEVINLHFLEGKYEIQTQQDIFYSLLVIGAYGKRSKIDHLIDRDFIKRRSPFVGVKYHVRTDHVPNTIELHNFSGGYCGVSNVENQITNLCYLTHRNNLHVFKNIKDMEENVLYKNPLLKRIFCNADFLFKKPETINEISFETKQPVENHILMVGDAAGMITPLCGNGMAMAIRSAKIVTDLIIDLLSKQNFNREGLEQSYSRAWRKEFLKRLWVGRQAQKLFGSPLTSSIAMNLMIHVKPLAKAIIRNTHGKPF